MAYDYGNDEETAELERLNYEVQADPDDFERWERLIGAAESLEGGLNRNSAPQSIAAARDAYDRLLTKYPLFFGYWKKYAELEFAIAGTEAAEMIYERGVAGVGVSVDLWANYCMFKVETCHEPELTRELFERAADSCGLDFTSHHFWDKYLEFEERVNPHDSSRVFAILERLMRTPLHQYSRYFERFQRMATAYPTSALASDDIVQSIRYSVLQELGPRGAGTADIDHEVRHRLEQHHMQIYQTTHNEVTKRWAFEQAIKRPYFHVTELEPDQLSNWQKYLDFEEGEGDYVRTAFLYERSLVATAHYDDFWQRYVHWMYAQGGKEEECRNIYERASCVFLPIARPAIRFQWAIFEESCGRADVAGAIYDAILSVLPGSLEAITALIELTRRQDGYEAAIAVCKEYLASDVASLPSTKGRLVGELAKLSQQIDGDAYAGRAIFEQHKSRNIDHLDYWQAYLDYEISIPHTRATEKDQAQRVQSVHDSIMNIAQLDTADRKELSQRYMRYLQAKGDRSSAKAYMDLDTQVNGPLSVISTMRSRQLVKPKDALATESRVRTNGHDA